MKKLINAPDDVVPELLEGVALTQPGLALLTDRTIAVRADALAGDDRPVAIISGGGAGHEPAHAGYVAEGMLTAAVSGQVFASPSVDAVLDAIRAVTGPAGCLLVVKSYTGDRLNFGMAAELARGEGLDVEMVVVGDDVALADSDTHAGRRGLAGTVLVHKVAGALAARGAGLAEVAAAARSVAERVGTMSVALTGATVPGADDAGFDLPDDEVELGLGIHGEPGVERRAIAGADDLVGELVTRIVEDRGLRDGDRIVALVGSAGGTSPMDLAICARAAAAAVDARGLVLERLWSGPVMTSIDMVGVSVSLLPVDDALIALLDAPTASLAWPGAPGGDRPEVRHAPVPEVPAAAADDAGAPDERVRAAIDAACRALLDARRDLDEADRHVGDGDLGSALARGATAWLDDPVDGDAAHLLRTLSATARRAIGGTSGPLYGMLLLKAGEALADGNSWPQALRAGVDGVRDLGGAAPGDGTMVDALDPAADAAVGAASDPLAAAIEAAEQGIADTVESTASKGRASYLGGRSAGEADPGAVAVLCWLRALRG